MAWKKETGTAVRAGPVGRCRRRRYGFLANTTARWCAGGTGARACWLRAGIAGHIPGTSYADPGTFAERKKTRTACAPPFIYYLHADTALHDRITRRPRGVQAKTCRMRTRIPPRIRNGISFPRHCVNIYGTAVLCTVAFRRVPRKRVSFSRRSCRAHPVGPSIFIRRVCKTNRRHRH